MITTFIKKPIFVFVFFVALLVLVPNILAQSRGQNGAGQDAQTGNFSQGDMMRGILGGTGGVGIPSNVNTGDIQNTIMNAIGGTGGVALPSGMPSFRGASGNFQFPTGSSSNGNTTGTDGWQEGSFTGTQALNSEQFRAMIEQQKANGSTQFEQLRLQFTQRLSQLSNPTQKLNIEQINNKLSDATTKNVDKMSTALGRFSTILDSLTQRVEQAKSQGQDTTQIETGITSARDLITQMQQQVVNLAGKQYVIPINSDGTLRTDAATTIQQFQNDFLPANQSMTGIRTSIEDIIRQVPDLQGQISGMPIPSGTMTFPTGDLTPGVTSGVRMPPITGINFPNQLLNNQ